MKRLRKVLLGTTAVLLLLAAGGATFVAMRISNAVIATPRHDGGEARDPRTEHGLDFEPVAFETSDGLTLRGWLVPAEGVARAGAVLAHGRGGSRGSFLHMLPELRAAGICAVLYDTRGQGESDVGAPGDGFSGGYLDLVAAARLLEQRCQVQTVVAIGSSQGGSNAILAASRDDDAIDAVVAIGAGTNLYDVVRAAPTLEAMPDWMIAYATRLTLWRMDVPFERVLDVGVGPVTYVAEMAPKPLFLIHGSEDETVPVGQAGRLYANARGPKSFWVVKGGPHVGLRSFVGAEFGKRVMHFVERRVLSGS